MKAIFNREFNSYFNGIIGYVFCAAILLFAGLFMLFFNLRGASPLFEYVLVNMYMCFVLIVAVAVLTMRSIAEERRQKTDQLLYSLPITSTKIVMGKYLAMVAVLAIPMLVMCVYPVILSTLGNVDLGAAYNVIFGFFLLGASLIAIGLFISSITENQAVAAALCIVIMFLFYFMSDLASVLPLTAFVSLIALIVSILILGLIMWLLTKNVTVSAVFTAVCEIILLVVYFVEPTNFYGLFPAVVGQLSFFERFYVFGNGIFDLTAVVYYLSGIGIFLFLTVQSLEKRRWS